MTYVAGTPPDNRFHARVQSRSHAADAPAIVEITGERTVQITFDTPQDGISPGQSAVIYCGDEVVGGGRILA